MGRARAKSGLSRSAVVFHAWALQGGAWALTLAWATHAQGLPGTHAPAISTFDTRSSSVVFSYRESLTATTFRAFSYNANFTSTSGNFSAQFGAHYVQLKDAPGVRLLHGAGASGVGLFSIPLTGRYDNGVPKVAWVLYGGAVPTAAISGPRNFLTVPVTLGTGFSFSPAPFLTITPWFEVAPGFNVDTYIAPFDLNAFVEEQERKLREDVTIDDVINNQGEVALDVPDVEQVIQEAVDLRFSFKVAGRAGLQTTLHLGETFDFNLYGDVLTFGAFFDGAVAVQAGAALAFHWDDIVPAVLPAHRRLSGESCEAIEARYLMCPGSRRVQPLAQPTSTPRVVPGPVPNQPAAPRPKPAPQQTLSPDPAPPMTGTEPTDGAPAPEDPNSAPIPFAPTPPPPEAPAPAGPAPSQGTPPPSVEQMPPLKKGTPRLIRRSPYGG